MWSTATQREPRGDKKNKERAAVAAATGCMLFALVDRGAVHWMRARLFVSSFSLVRSKECSFSGCAVASEPQHAREESDS